MSENVIQNKGYNKLLYEKRLSLSLSLKEASKKLHISRVMIHLIENGYITLTPRLKNKFIEGYSLEKDFFENDLAYPVMISEEKYNEASEFTKKLTHNKIYKISCVILAIGFFVMAICGVKSNIDTKNSIPSFFDQSIIDLRTDVINNPDDTYTDAKTGEITYYMNNTSSIVTPIPLVSIGFKENDQQLPYPEISGDHIEIRVVPFVDPDTPIEVRSAYTSKIKRKGQSVTMVFTNKLKTIARCEGSKKDNGEYEFSLITMLNDEGTTTPLEKGDPNREKVIDLFNKTVVQYDNSFAEMFVSRSGINLTYDQFVTEMKQGTANLSGRTIMNGCLMLFGIALCALFFALSLLFLFKKDPMVEESGDVVADSEGSGSGSIEEAKSATTKELKRNWKIFPFIPGSFVRIASCLMIFVSSIGTYLIFNSITQSGIVDSMAIIERNQIFSAFMVVAFILLLFAKIEIVQEKKDYFLTNYFYFFSGLALYLLVLALAKLSVNDSTIRGTIQKVIIDVLPGNFLWGFLAFNMAIYLLFYTPLKCKNNPQKLRNFRLLAIIPFAYLLASLILGLIQSCTGVEFPVWFSFLFFTKSTYLIVFIVIFTLFCFLYKRYTEQKYGREKAALFQKGNRYYFSKNLVASAIIVVIGIFEIIFHFCDPNNPAGFGNNILIFVALPFVMLYHPHHGQRNGKIEMSITVFYGFAYVVGIALILLSVLSFIIRYF